MNKPEWVDKIEVIGWDLDGTLYPGSSELSLEIGERLMDRLTRKLGIEQSQAEEVFGKARERYGSSTTALTELGLDGPDVFVSIWEELDLAKYIQPDPEMVKLFDKLGNKRHFLLSNSNTVELIEEKLELIGVPGEVFEQIVSTVDVGKNKPDVRPFEVAIELMKIDKDAVVYVGDRVETDVRGAHNAGLRAILVGKESQEADLCLGKTYEMEELFGY